MALPCHTEGEAIITIKGVGFNNQTPSVGTMALRPMGLDHLEEALMLDVVGEEEGLVKKEVLMLDVVEEGEEGLVKKEGSMILIQEGEEIMDISLLTGIFHVFFNYGIR